LSKKFEEIKTSNYCTWETNFKDIRAMGYSFNSKKLFNWRIIFIIKLNLYLLSQIANFVF